MFDVHHFVGWCGKVFKRYNSIVRPIVVLLINVQARRSERTF
jgi:hypothetical protein